jgi:hypothetical protein
MLNLLDRVIEKVLDSGWTKTPPPIKPGFYFAVPDEEWRQKVKQGMGLRLNIYLYELRENREFRHADWDMVELSDRTAQRSRPPVYYDCHYLISAWSPAEDSEAVSPVLDEHQALAEAMRVLARNPDVTPAALDVPGGGPVFQGAHIYLTVAPPDGQSILKDFWGTMKLPWRPAIHLVAVAPLDLLQDEPSGPLLTTIVQRYARAGGSGGVDERIQVGGWVLRTSDDTPIAGATVRHMTTGEEVITDAQGRFVLARLRRGTHSLRAEASGMQEDEHELEVPDGPAEQHIFRLS